jgi:hypothetical protein
MSEPKILWILPLLVLTIPLAAFAKDISSMVPINLGQAYTGSLTPSPSNPHGEVCYKLALKSDTRIKLNVKTSGVGIVKFAVYDKSKSLRFFHNHVNNQPQSAADVPTDSRVNFPIIGDASQLCLTTSNLHRSQQYDLTVIGNPSRKSKSRLKLRSVAGNPVTVAKTKPPVDIPPVTPQIPPVVTPQIPPVATPQIPPVATPQIPPVATPPIPPVATPPIAATVELPSPPSNEPFCYVGTWQIADLSAYWLPTIQNFTQAEISDRQMLGYAKVTITKNGYAQFEAIDLEQQYTLKSKENGVKLDRIGLGLAGNVTAKFQVNPDGTLTFGSQNDRRLTTKLNLGTSLRLTGDKLFTFFGDRDLPPVKLPYTCLDRDNMTLKVPVQANQKLIPISFKRVN